MKSNCTNLLFSVTLFIAMLALLAGAICFTGTPVNLPEIGWFLAVITIVLPVVAHLRAGFLRRLLIKRRDSYFVFSVFCLFLGGSWTAYAQTCPPVSGPAVTSCPSGTLEYLASPRYVNGDPLAGGEAGNLESFVVFPYSASGKPGDPGYVAPTQSAKGLQVGALWGVAASPTNNAWYTSAVLKRHSGLGPRGLGGIYKFDYTTGTWSSFDADAFPGVNLGTISRVPYDGMPLGPNELPADPQTPNWDVDAFGQVAKRGLGGIDLSSDGNTLWAMNLFSRQLLQINVSGPTPSLTSTYNVPDPGCTNGSYRPWAVKFHNGKVYVGVVCDASSGGTAANLRAYVYVLDPVANTWCEVYNFPLNYDRNTLHSPDGALSDGDWRPWIDSRTWTGTVSDWVHPQPVLSDIEFDMDGSMIVAFLDRHAFQMGSQNYTTDVNSTAITSIFGGGDILRVGISGGAYALENNGVAGLGTGGNVTTSAANTLTPAGPGGKEFYWGEYFNYFNSGSNPPQGINNGGAHTETAVGALAFKPGSGEIRASSYDPQNVNNGGAISLSNTDGSSLATGRYEVYPAVSPTFMAKGAGLGDLEFTCLPQLSLGNLVFIDNNRDGNYDLGTDTPLPGVTVELYEAPGGVVSATPKATQVTGSGASAGLYLFTDLIPGQYIVKVASGNFSGAGALAGYTSSSGNSTSGDDNTSEDGVDVVPFVGDAVSSSLITLGTLSPSGAAEGGVNGTSDDANDGYTDLTVDFGFIRRLDMGDLPDLAAGTATGDYETLSDNNGASHWMSTGLKLGNAIDDETNGQPNTAANNDDNSLTVHNFARTGTVSGTTQGFGGVITNPIDGDTRGTSWSHTDGSANPFWRVDFSNAGTINQVVIWNRTDCCSSRLNNALVELLDANGTTVWSGNVGTPAQPSNTFSVGGVYASALRVSLTGAQILSLAEVQVFGTLDDEDGIALPAVVNRNTTISVPVMVMGAPSGAKLNAFFDWNGDGDFGDAGETVSELSVSNGANTLSATVPVTAVSGLNLGARFRLSTAGGLSATGAANDGEIEDYLLQVACQSITSPSAPQTICVGSAGSDITVQTDMNTTNSIRFVRFTTDQMAGAAPTTTEAANIYAGAAVATVTPTGGASPYTATLTAATAGWSSLAPGTYYVYAILNPDPGASCRPVQEIVVTVLGVPSATITQSAATCSGGTSNNDGTIILSVASNVTNFGISTQGAATYDGPSYPATAVSSLPQTILANIPNTGGSYIVRLFNTLAGCYVDEPVTVAPVTCVVPCVPPVISTVPGSVCLGNSIDLNSLIMGNAPAGTLSFHLTQADADMGVNPLVNAVVAPVSTTTYYVRSTVSAACYSTVALAVAVNQSPAFTAINGQFCAGGSINLATLVTNSGGGTLSYFTSLANAQNNTNALASSVVAPSSATNYFIRSTNAAGCYTIQNVVVSLAAANCGAVQVAGPN